MSISRIPRLAAVRTLSDITQDFGEHIFDDDKALEELNLYFADYYFIAYCADNGSVKYYKPFKFSNMKKYRYEEIIHNIYLIFEFNVLSINTKSDPFNMNGVQMNQLYTLFKIESWDKEKFKKYLKELGVLNIHYKGISDNAYVCSWQSLSKIIDNFNSRFVCDDYRKDLMQYIFIEYDRLMVEAIHKSGIEHKVRLLGPYHKY